MFCRLRESIRPGILGKALGVLREYVVEDRLLPTVNSLYSCSDVCCRVGEVELQTFTVGIDLRQGCVLAPLLFIVYIRGDKPICYRRPLCLLPLSKRAAQLFSHTMKPVSSRLLVSHVCFAGRTKFFCRTHVRHPWSICIG